MNTKSFIISSLIISLLSNSPILIIGQINTPCSQTMLSSLTGCMSFLTGSSNGNSPTSECCEALKSLTGTGVDCLCLIVTASVPLNLPINRTLAISLPRACGMPGVPVICKASAAPLPSPGPVSLGPTTFPTDTQAPEADDDNIKESGNGRDPTALTPSASLPSSSHFLKIPFLLFVFAFMIINLF